MPRPPPPRAPPRQPGRGLSRRGRTAGRRHALDYRAAVFPGALGLRQGEIFGLRVGAIDFLRRTLTLTATLNEVEGIFVEGHGKTVASGRTISVPAHILEELAAHLARTQRTSPEDLAIQAQGGPVRATKFRRHIYDPR